MSDDSLVAALARAQAKFARIAKGQENPHFRSKYADIADVLEVVRPTLAAEGIAVSQPVRITEHGCELVTVLLYGAERMESAFPMPDNLAPQQTLSWLTYMRRGLLCSMVGVHPAGEDDDGNDAQAAVPQERSWESGSRFSKTSTGKPATDKQVKLADRLLTEVVHMNLHAAYVEQHAGRNVPLEELSTAEASKLIDALQDRKKAGGTPDGDIDPMTEPF